MNVQKRPPPIAQSANRAAKLPPQEINARVESKGETAASDTTEAKSELNAARLALQERAQTPEGRQALANALDGRMASERTTVELLVMEELFLLRGTAVNAAKKARRSVPGNKLSRGDFDWGYRNGIVRLQRR